MDMDGDPSFPELSIVMNGSSSCLDQSSFFRNGSVYNSSLPFMNSVMISGNRDTQEQAGITLDDFLESFVPVPPPVGDIYGTDGPDIFQDNVADHTIYGGAGQDTVSYLHRDGPVIVFLAGISAAPVLVGGRLEDLLFDVENIYGTPQDDILGGDGADNVFYGGPGRDIIDGGSGLDLAVYADSCLPVEAVLNGSRDSVVHIGGIAEDTLRNIEGIHGGSASDHLTGDQGDNIFYGHAGDDILYGLDGDDRFYGGPGRDILDGGAGSDLVDYSEEDEPVRVHLAGSADVTVLVGAREEDTLRGIENVVGGFGDDCLTGDDGANILDGGPGINVLTGGGGADVFVFGFPGTSHVVTDFDHREGDLLDADTALPGIQRFGFSDTGAAAHAVWFSFDPRLGGTGVYADVDGDAGQPELSVFLSGVERLSKADVSQDTFVVSPLRRGSLELSFDGTEDDTITVDLGIAGYQAGTLQNPYRVSGLVDSSVAHVSAGAGNDHIIGDVQGQCSVRWFW